MTGVSGLSPELSRRRLELVREAFPKVSRVAVLFHGANPTNIAALNETEAAASMLLVHVQRLDVRNPEDFKPAFADAARRVDALLVARNALYQAHLIRIVTLTVNTRLPAIYPVVEYVNAGGLMSYGGAYYGPVPPRCNIRRQNFKRGQARRVASRAANKVCTGHQSKNRKANRSNHSAKRAGSG